MSPPSAFCFFGIKHDSVFNLYIGEPPTEEKEKGTGRETYFIIQPTPLRIRQHNPNPLNLTLTFWSNFRFQIRPDTTQRTTRPSSTNKSVNPTVCLTVDLRPSSEEVCGVV